jgi:pimeloyl-ACP methyl ester carboxylesterase
MTATFTRTSASAHAAARAAPATSLPLAQAAADLQGAARLGIDAVIGITDLVEAMHHTIASPASGVLGRRVNSKENATSNGHTSGRTSGLAGAIYRSVRGTTRLVGRGADLALNGVQRLLPQRDLGSPQLAQHREALRAALNGIWGDHLADSGNPLAIPMSLQLGGQVIDLEHASARTPNAPLDITPDLVGAGDKLLVLIHGLGMNALQWQRKGHDHGQALAAELGYTPVYLHYNSGRHVSHNGAELARLLEQLVVRWPVRLREVVLLGHSMGGLVARSACHCAQQAQMRWPEQLTRMVFLGTPHHGAPLERGGKKLDTLFEMSPYIAPFARIGQSRSAGITDLRFGNVQDADWRGRADANASPHADLRHPTPLPAGVRSFAMAATVSKKLSGRHTALLGDGLVPVASALGQHANPALTLYVPSSNKHVLAAAHHWDLLDRAEAYQTLQVWLG